MNHQPLIHTFAKSSDAWSSRHQRHLAAMAEFGCTISYVPGKKNPVTDALSRIEINTVHLGIDYTNLSVEQQSDPEAQDYHDKVSGHTESGVGDFSQPKRRFGHIHMDIMRPLPPSGSARYLLTIVDRSNRWLGATTMSEATTHACAKALLSSWISRFDVPDDITTDQGFAFLSEIWLSLANVMGTTLHSTTAYNPAVNGMVERTHRTLKVALMARYGEPSPAEKVYGESLTVPGEFFPATTKDTKLNHLREIAGKLRPCLETYEDRTRTSCPRTYPYKFIRRTAKSFLLNVHGQEDWVTIDRLKPVFLESNEKITVSPGRPKIPPQNKSSTKGEETT
ncbi:uncharacterized protein [Palaemon carinicauda]|uniref:uncharacterized protein n=1 Tax=Palaemon carinicauda TaxID=392227 RepID=UPI0035B5DDD8